MWLRGAWFDAISALWNEVESGRFTTNDGQADPGWGGRNGGSVLVSGRLAPGAETTIPVVLTWFFPEFQPTLRRGGRGRRSAAKHFSRPGGRCRAGHPRGGRSTPGIFQDAAGVADHIHRHYETLRARTLAFQKALFSTDAPREVLGCRFGQSCHPEVAHRVAPGKRQRLGLGGLLGRHGELPRELHARLELCAGAAPPLFPALERTLREQELERSMDERGHVNFRAALPDGPTPHEKHAAADGQLGGLMKLYRDWQISGDDRLAGASLPGGAARPGILHPHLGPGPAAAGCSSRTTILTTSSFGGRMACAGASTSAHCAR